MHYKPMSLEARRSRSACDVRPFGRVDQGEGGKVGTAPSDINRSQIQIRQKPRLDVGLFTIVFSRALWVTLKPSACDLHCTCLAGIVPPRVIERAGKFRAHFAHCPLDG